MIIRRLLALCMVCLLSAGTVGAAEAPDAVVKDTAEKVLSKLRAQREAIRKDPNKIYDVVETDVLPRLDFERMSQFVLGKYWQRATPDQRARFVEQFKRLLVRTYAKALFENVDADIDYLPLRMASGADEAVVKTEVNQPGGQPIPIDYKVYRSANGEWKVFDVVIDGVSLVGNYRTTFANEVRQSGLDQLIAKLAARSQQVEKQNVKQVGKGERATN